MDTRSTPSFFTLPAVANPLPVWIGNGVFAEVVSMPRDTHRSHAMTNDSQDRRDKKLLRRMARHYGHAELLLARLEQVVEGRAGVRILDRDWARQILMAALAGASDNATGADR